MVAEGSRLFPHNILSVYCGGKVLSRRAAVLPSAWRFCLDYARKISGLSVVFQGEYLPLYPDPYVKEKAETELIEYAYLEIVE